MTWSKLIYRSLWIGLLTLTIAAGAYLARAPLLEQIGRSLVRADPLVRADAIVVLAGGTPLRELEAADLYLAGYAPRIVMTLESESSAPALMRARGVPFESGIELRKRIVRALGVPDEAVTVLDHARAESTRSEAELIRDWISSTRFRRIIIVTAPYHTRRAAIIFNRTLRGREVEVLVRPASHDAFNSQDWWRNREQLRNGIFEWQKLVFYYFAYR